MTAISRAAWECRELAGILVIGMIVGLVTYAFSQPAPHLPVCGPHVTGMCMSAWDRDIYSPRPRQPARPSQETAP